MQIPIDGSRSHSFLNLWKAFQESLKEQKLPTPKPLTRFLLTSLADQKLFLAYFDGLSPVFEKTYSVSTGKNPPSCLENSFGTPWGLHEICEKIGAGLPLGTVFIGRRSTGLIASEHPDRETKGLITTRILRLQGLEIGLNRGVNAKDGTCCDTHKRYVYMHGMYQEALAGTPSSHGCIQLKNLDMLELFNTVEIGTYLFIGKPS